MTEPVARAVSPRRTVRVAVALVAGQAALCAVIGWVTFGPSEAKPQAAGAQPVTTPVVLPTLPRVPGETAPLPPAPAASTTSAARASKSSRPPTTRPTSRSAEEKPRPVIAPGETPAAQPDPPDLALSPPPSPVGGSQTPPAVDKPCDPEGAEAETSDGIELRCVQDADGDLLWQII